MEAIQNAPRCTSVRRVRRPGVAIHHSPGPRASNGLKSRPNARGETIVEMAGKGRPGHGNYKRWCGAPEAVKTKGCIHKQCKRSDMDNRRPSPWLKWRPAQPPTHFVGRPYIWAASRAHRGLPYYGGVGAPNASLLPRIASDPTGSNETRLPCVMRGVLPT